jgi:hypothetical protein
MTHVASAFRPAPTIPMAWTIRKGTLPEDIFFNLATQKSCEKSFKRQEPTFELVT